MIKKVQRGTTIVLLNSNPIVEVKIDAVDYTKSIVLLNQTYPIDSKNLDKSALEFTIRLKNSTTIEIERGSLIPDNYSSCKLDWQVVEFE